MRKYCLLFFVLLSFIPTYAYHSADNEINFRVEKKKIKNSSTLKIKKKNKRYGVIDESNRKIIIPFIYSKIISIHQDGFAAMNDTKWIIYNASGENISQHYSFENIHIPSETEGNNKIIVIGKEKKKSSSVVVIIKDKEEYLTRSYDEILSISPNYFHVIKKNKCGTLTIEGKETIPVVYKNISYLKTSKKSDPYLAKVQNDYYGYIDVKTGEIILSARWEQADLLSPTLFRVKEKNSGWGIVNNQDQEVIPPRYSHITALSPKLIKVEDKDNRFFVSIDSRNPNNEIVTSDSLIIDQQNMKFGVRKGNTTLLPFEYDYITTTPQQIFIVARKQKFKLIDYSGKEITPYYKHIEYNELTQNFLAQNAKGKWEIINYKGDVLLETKYTTKSKIIDYLNEKPVIKYKKSKKNTGSGALEIAGEVGKVLLYIVGFAFYAVFYVIASLVELSYI